MNLKKQLLVGAIGALLGRSGMTHHLIAAVCVAWLFAVVQAKFEVYGSPATNTRCQWNNALALLKRLKVAKSTFACD